jgi:Domain of unknown function (DUF4291)
MTMHLSLARYEEQRVQWPVSGRPVMALFDASSIVVYQAYAPAIGQYAAAHQRFGGDFSYSRMSWIKPNFLWMMFRNGWGTKANQEVALAITLRRTFFDELLALAVPSSFDSSEYATHEAWQLAVKRAHVRLQWDLDHDPKGARQERRAIQLGLRGDTLRPYGTEAILRIDDISDFVAEQREVLACEPLQLLTPVEHPYPQPRWSC